MSIKKRIERTLRKGLIITGFFCWLVLAFLAVVDTEGKKIGDVSDGSLSAAVHVIGLLDGEGDKISPDVEPVLPFSMRQTCSACHSYEVISQGWHFNAVDVNAVPGRKGQPWIFVDPTTCTQIPLSYRPWAGVFHPEELGLSSFKFTQLFGRQMPGGGVGEMDSDDPEDLVRQDVSGKLEINCLSCHNAAAGQDQAEYAGQVTRQNFRWAAAAACEFASVTGAAVTQPDTYDPLMDDAIATTYRENTFDHEKKVSFDVTRKVPNERCYFCHSSLDVGEHGSEEWEADEDIHLSAGLTCVDCHRNGLDHNIIRGYECEPGGEEKRAVLTTTTTCKGCHTTGRLGAPVPEHPGIPPIHFEKITCTACHSGPWPEKVTHHNKTSQAHALGTHGSNKSDDALPHILYPVFAQAGDKITPHKLIWPAFWATLKDEEVTPIDLNLAKKAVGRSLLRAKPRSLGDWPTLTEEHITKALNSLKKTVEGEPVYICGGKLYSIDESGELREPQEHPAAQPYLWPVAHNVRPAAQALGVRYCTDCHATDAPFFFGEVQIDTPLAVEEVAKKEMIEFQDISPFYAWAFAFSFVFRPWLKVIALGSCGLIGLVLLLYVLRALTCVVNALAKGNS